MYCSMHAMDGDPEALIAAKRQHMDPVVARLAPRHGAVLSVTIPTESGISVFNVWQDEAGARAFTAEPDAQRAQAASGLPMPSSFQRWTGAQLDLYP